MLEVIAGRDVRHPTTSDAAVLDKVGAWDGSLKGIRIGVPRTFFFDSPDLDAEVAAAVEIAITQLAEAGASISEIKLPLVQEASAATIVILRSEAFAYHQHWLRTKGRLYGKHLRRQLLVGALFSAADYLHAQGVATAVRRAWPPAMAAVDVLLAPTTATTAILFEGHEVDSDIAEPDRLGVFNLSGLPAMSIPCGFSSSGLPIGMQIIGKPFDEPAVIKVGDTYQHFTDWHRRQAPLFDEYVVA